MRNTNRNFVTFVDIDDATYETAFHNPRTMFNVCKPHQAMKGIRIGYILGDIFEGEKPAIFIPNLKWIYFFYKNIRHMPSDTLAIVHYQGLIFPIYKYGSSFRVLGSFANLNLVSHLFESEQHILDVFHNKFTEKDKYRIWKEYLKTHPEGYDVNDPPTSGYKK